MAEEKFEQSSTDDQSVLNILLERVRGLSLVSTPIIVDDTGEDVEFDT